MLKNLCKFLLILSLFLGLWPGLAGGVAVEAAVEPVPLINTGWFSAKGATLIKVDGKFRAFVDCNETGPGGDSNTGSGQACLGYFLRDKETGQIVQTGDPITKTVDNNNYEIVTVRSSVNSEEDKILQLPDLKQYTVYKIPGTFQQPDLLVVQSSGAQGNSAGNYIAMQADSVAGFNQVNRLNEEGLPQYRADLAAKINSADIQQRLSLTGASVVGVNTNTAQTAARDTAQQQATVLSVNGVVCTTTLGKDNKAIFECVKDGKKVSPDGNPLTGENCAGFTLKDGTKTTKAEITDAQMDNACVSTVALNESKTLQANNTATAAGGDATSSVAGAVGNELAIRLLNFIAAFLLVLVYFIGWVVIFIVWMLLHLFIWILRVNPAGVEFVQVAVEPWQVVIGLANLVVLFWFIMVGFGYLLNIKNLKKGIQEFLLNLVIYTLALNFSLLAVATVVNVSQGVGEIMLGSIAATQNKNPREVLVGGLLDGVAIVSTLRCGNLIEESKNNPAALERCTVTSRGGGFGEFIGAVTGGLTGGTGNVDTGNAAAAIASGNFGDIFKERTGGAASHLMMEFAFVVILSYVIYNVWRGVYLVLTRTVGLWMFMVCSPLILACKLSPFPQLQKKADEFINTGFQFILFYPAMIFGLALVATLSRSFGIAIQRQGTSFSDISSTNLPGFIQAYAEGDITLDDYLRTFMIAVLIAAVSTAAFGALIGWFASSFANVAKTVLGGLKNAWNFAKEGSYFAGTPVRMIGDSLKNRKFVQAVTGNETFKKIGNATNKFTLGGAGMVRRSLRDAITGNTLLALQDKADFAKQVVKNYAAMGKEDKAMNSEARQYNMKKAANMLALPEWLGGFNAAQLLAQKYDRSLNNRYKGASKKEMKLVAKDWMIKNPGKTIEDFWNEEEKDIRLQASMKESEGGVKVLKGVGLASMRELVNKFKAGAKNIADLQGEDLDTFRQYLEENPHDTGLRDMISMNPQLLSIVRQLYSKKLIDSKARAELVKTLPLVDEDAIGDMITDLTDPNSNRRSEIDDSVYHHDDVLAAIDARLAQIKAEFGEDSSIYQNLKASRDSAKNRSFERAKKPFNEADEQNNIVNFNKTNKAVEVLAQNPAATPRVIVESMYGSGGNNQLTNDFSYQKGDGTPADFVSGESLELVVQSILDDSTTRASEKIDILNLLAQADPNFKKSNYYQGAKQNLKNITGPQRESKAQKQVMGLINARNKLQDDYGDPDSKKLADAREKASKKNQVVVKKVAANGLEEVAKTMEKNIDITRVEDSTAIKVGVQAAQTDIITQTTDTITSTFSVDPAIERTLRTEAQKYANEEKKRVGLENAPLVSSGQMTVTEANTEADNARRDAETRRYDELVEAEKGKARQLVQGIGQKATEILAMKANGSSTAELNNHLDDLREKIRVATAAGVTVDSSLITNLEAYATATTVGETINILPRVGFNLKDAGITFIEERIAEASSTVVPGPGADQKTAQNLNVNLRRQMEAWDEEVQKHETSHKRQDPSTWQRFIPSFARRP